MSTGTVAATEEFAIGPQEATDLIVKFYSLRVPRGGGTKTSPPCVLLVGPPGVGKTAAPQVAAEILGVPCATVVAVDSEPYDFKGTLSLETGHFMLPPWLERIKNEGEGIVIVDEALSASQATQRAIDRLADDVDANGNEYPPFMLILTGNIPGGPEGARMPPAHLVDRSFVIHVKACPEEWSVWAVENGIHPVVLAFHRWTNWAHFATPCRGGKANVNQVTTPRGWHQVSCIYKTDPDLGVKTISAAVHPEDAVAFLEYAKLRNSLPDWQSILKGETVPPVDPGRKDIALILAGALAMNAPLPDKGHIPGGLKAALDYMSDFPGDVLISFILDLKVRMNGDQLQTLIVGSRESNPAFYKQAMHILAG